MKVFFSLYVKIKKALWIPIKILYNPVLYFSGCFMQYRHSSPDSRRSLGIQIVMTYYNLHFS